MSSDALNWAWNKVRGINGPQKAVLARLADFADERNTCYPGKDRIATDCCLSKRTVDQAIKSLEDMGLITIENRRLDGKGREDPDGKKQTSNRYTLNLDHIGQSDLFRGAGAAGVKEVQGCKSSDLGVQEPQGEGAGASPEPLLEPKEEPKTYCATGVAPPAQGYKSKKGKTLSGKCLDQFEYFWNVFHHNWEKRGKAPAADQWYALCRNQEIPPRLWQQIIGAATSEARRRPQLLEKGLTPIMAEGWLSARRWEDEEFQPAQQANPHAGEAPWYSRLETVQEKAGDVGLQVRDYDTHVELFDALIEKLRDIGDEVPAALVDYRNQIEKAVA